MSIWGNPVWLRKSGGGKYYLFQSGHGDPSNLWEAFPGGARVVTIGTDSISFTSKSGSGSFSSLQYTPDLVSILPNYSTLYMEFQFSSIGTGIQRNRAFGLAANLRTTQGDYTWNAFQSVASASINTRVTLSLDISSYSSEAGYFAFVAPVLGDIYNVWLE